jgi:hypothetical protein
VIASGEAAGEERESLREKATALHPLAHAECFIASSVAFPVRNEPLILFEDDPAGEPPASLGEQGP